jgi:hypothetical protein
MGRQFIKDSQTMKSMMSGKIPSTQEQRDQMQARLFAMADHLGGKGKNSTISKIIGGDYSNLPDLSNDQQTRDWMKSNINYSRSTQSMGDSLFSEISKMPFSGGYIAPNTRAISPVTHPLPPAPAVKSGPTSINYNTKVIQYGYTADQTSAVNTPHNNLG